MVEVEEEMRGNFGGIGVQFSIQNDTVMVVDVVSGGTSSKLGIIPGDRYCSGKRHINRWCKNPEQRCTEKTPGRNWHQSKSGN
jgi:predicted metalloprotease with PDZ domain